MQKSEIQSIVTPVILLTVVSENADGNEVRKTWKLCFDYRAIAKAEIATGRDIKKIESWKNISSGKDFPAIVHAGLNRYNPEVTLDEVLDILNPMAQVALSDEIFYYMFPGMREALAKTAAAESGDEGFQKATLNS